LPQPAETAHMQHSIKKRVRITKNGKVMRRKMAQDHFRAKRTGKQTRQKRKGASLEPMDAKVFKKLINLNN